MPFFMQMNGGAFGVFSPGPWPWMTNDGTTNNSSLATRTFGTTTLLDEMLEDPTTSVRGSILELVKMLMTVTVPHLQSQIDALDARLDAIHA